MKAIVILVVLVSCVIIQGRAVFPASPKQVPELGSGTGNNPTIVVLWATPSGWNGDWTPSLNPTFTEFRGVMFGINASWGFAMSAGGTYDIAIYTAGFPATSVSPTNGCNPTSTGCLARSNTIGPSLHYAWATLTPLLPKDDFSGPARYDYFDEYHPTIGHGTIVVYKSPDLSNQGRVNIVDLSQVAFSFGATPTSPRWNVSADLNNDGEVNILDLAFQASYFGQQI